MKYILIAFLLFPILSPAQDNESISPLARFNKGLEHYENGNLDSTLIIWEEMVDKKIGVDSDVYGNAFFNIPTIYWELEEQEKAKTWYLRILASDLKDNDETGSLMDPHTNYKHKSATALAGLYEEEADYAQVLHWLTLAETKYPYWGFIGSNTNISQRKEYLLNWKAGVYMKMDSTEQAIKALLTELICGGEFPFFEESEQAFHYLTKDLPFKTSFDAALDDLEIKTLDANSWEATFNLRGFSYTIPIRNIRPPRELPHYWSILFIEEGSSPEKSQIIKKIKSRSFYENLEE